MTNNELMTLVNQLSDESLQKLREYAEFLKWREIQAESKQAWAFNFIEHFGNAQRGAERDTAGLEIKVGDAACAGVSRAALWEHPPVSGAAKVSYVVPIPPKLRGLKLRFAIGIRDGAELPPDRYVAFRVTVNDWKLWSAVKNSHHWDDYEVKMPELSSDVIRIEFITDGLGDHRWNWAVWGQPELVGETLK
ncbi:MAG: hypothetical protein WCF84_22530 [Anaerolineae bacterium]